MKRKARTIAVAFVAVLALTAAGYAATGGIEARTSSRASVVPPKRTQQPTRTVQTVRRNHVVKRIVTVRSGKSVVTTTTWVTNGKRYVVSVAREAGKLVKVVRHVTTVGRANAKATKVAQHLKKAPSAARR